MTTWTATTYTESGSVLAYLRLGSYLATEESLKPSQFPGDFTSSEGLFLTTTGNLYLNADQTIQVEFKDDAELVVGDFSSQDTVMTKIDATAGDGYAAFKADGVALNAVTDASTAKAASASQLTLYASDNIQSTSVGDTRFHSAGDVYILNNTETTATSQSKTLTMGSSTSLVEFARTDITAGINMLLVGGVRTSVALYSSETMIVSFRYAMMSNEISFVSADNKGLSAFLKNSGGLIGVLMQENELSEDKQESLGNGVSGGKIVNRLVGTKSGSAAAQGGIQNQM